MLAVPRDGGPVREVGRVAEATPQGEAGLLGLATSPTYEQDSLVYAYVSTAQDNRVVRMEYDGRRLGGTEPVLTGIPNGFIHDGGRLLFAEDGTPFVSTGEIGEEQLAQDRDSLAARSSTSPPTASLRRTTHDRARRCGRWGTATCRGSPSTTPGRLWASEFGANTWDELNLVEKARNYGWPLFEGRGG